MSKLQKYTLDYLYIEKYIEYYHCYLKTLTFTLLFNNKFIQIILIRIFKYP